MRVDKRRIWHLLRDKTLHEMGSNGMLHHGRIKEGWSKKKGGEAVDVLGDSALFSSNGYHVLDIT